VSFSGVGIEVDPSVNPDAQQDLPVEARVDYTNFSLLSLLYGFGRHRRKISVR
jgi:hypothetical protein